VGVGVAVVAVLTAIAVAVDGPTALDRSLSTWVAQHRSAWLVSTMRVATQAGSFRAILFVGAVAAIVGWSKRDLRPLAFIVVTATVASWVTNGMKLAVARPRPGPAIAVRAFAGYSFPSGHATTAAALWGAVAVVLVAAGRCSWRWAALSWAAIVLVVASSRVVLGAHWPTDVVAGAAVGSTCVAAAVVAERASVRPRRASPGASACIHV
jgi:undecaprenyl-diphosphatase